MAVLGRSREDDDAFALQIHRYSQALIDLANVDSQPDKILCCGRIRMDEQLCAVHSNGGGGLAKHFSLLTHIFTPLLTEPRANPVTAISMRPGENGDTEALPSIK